MASSEFTNVQNTHLRRHRNQTVVQATLRLPQDFGQHGCRHECVCTWVWTSHLSASTSKIRMMMKDGLESSLDKKHVSSVMSCMFVQAKKRPFKGCLMFGMSLFSRFSGCFSALAFPIDLFLWVWEQFCVNRTYEKNPFREQKDASFWYQP